MNPAISVALLVLGAVLTFIATSYWHWREKKAAEAAHQIVEKDLLRTRLAELEKQVALVGQCVVPINAAFQAMLIRELTHFHTPELDALLVKIGPPYVLTVEEERLLAADLQKRSEDVGAEITESEREAAIILPYVIKRSRSERRAL